MGVGGWFRLISYGDIFMGFFSMFVIGSDEILYKYIFD